MMERTERAREKHSTGGWGTAGNGQTQLPESLSSTNCPLVNLAECLNAALALERVHYDEIEHGHQSGTMKCS